MLRLLEVNGSQLQRNALPPNFPLATLFFWQSAERVARKCHFSLISNSTFELFRTGRTGSFFADVNMPPSLKCQIGQARERGGGYVGSVSKQSHRVTLLRLCLSACQMSESLSVLSSSSRVAFFLPRAPQSGVWEGKREVVTAYVTSSG